MRLMKVTIPARLRGRKLAVCAAAVALFCAVDGAVITNANDVTVNVELGSAWVGGVAPGASDTAVFEAVNTTTRFKAGTDLSWYGMEWRHPTITAATPGIGISAATGSETLTVGAGGMTFLPLGSGGGPRIYIDMPVVVNVAQTWESLPNGTGYVYPHFTKPLSVNANLDVTMAASAITSMHEPITVASGATFSVDGNNRTSGNCMALILQDNARVTGAFEVKNKGGLCLALTNTLSTTRFSDLLSSFTNNCYFYLGGYEEFFSGRAMSVLFGPGDELTTTATGLERSDSALRVMDANVTVDGGNVRTRWFRLHNGRWTNRSGDTWFDYQNIVGWGAVDANRAVKEQTFDMQGGTYTFRRLAVGVANYDDIPARCLISGGTVTCDQPAPQAGSKWYCGLDLAVRWIRSEKRYANEASNEWNSVYAAGDVLVSGTGTLSVPRISFGGNTTISPSTTCVTNGAGRLRMTGGEIKMGTIGFLLGDLWGTTGESWYDVTFSGGKLTTLSNGAKQNMKVRLSNADGGVTYDVGSGHTYTVGSPMFGSGGLVKTGAGTMVLNCGNDYTGRTEIAAGSLVVKSASAATGAAYTPAGTTCPNATVRLVADDLAAANGESVSSWSAHSGSSPASVFTLSSAQNSAILGTGATAPVVTTDGFNGHKALSFNGVSSALACGGDGAAWVTSGNGSTTGFSVAMVVRSSARQRADGAMRTCGTLR